MRAVRARPAMYFGSVDDLGVEQVILQAVSAALDVVLAGRADEVSVSMDGRVVIVGYNGPPPPQHVFTTLGAFPPSDGLPSWLGARLGLGAMCAVCRRVDVWAVAAEGAVAASFSGGEVVSPFASVEEGGASGTTIRVEPDAEVFGDAAVDRRRLRAVLRDLPWQWPGLVVRFEGETFGPMPDDPGVGVARDERGIARVALVPAPASARPTSIRAFCNFAEVSSDGPIEEGLADATDGRPVGAVVALFLPAPVIDGQRHGRVRNPEARELLAAAVPST